MDSEAAVTATQEESVRAEYWVSVRRGRERYDELTFGSYEEAMSAVAEFTQQGLAVLFVAAPVGNVTEPASEPSCVQ